VLGCSPGPDDTRPATRPSAATEPEDAWDWLAARYDTNFDRRITRTEYRRSDEAFKNLDRDRDGVVTADDFERAPNRARNARRRTERGAAGPRTGFIPAAERERAPDFTLPREGEGMPVRLSSFADKRPVALIFGSYT
jgi:hypothetical protein